jgi:septal ring factor EnvC (AmiA/AmiB activator)
MGRLALVGCAAVLAAAVVSIGAAGQVPHGEADAAALAERAKERMRALHDEADRLVLEERSVLRQLRRLELDRQIAIEDRRVTDLEVVVATAAVEATGAEIQRLEAKRDRERPVIAARLVDAYKLGRGRYGRLLLSTTDIALIGQASRAVAALAARDQARLAMFDGQRVALEGARLTLETRRRELDVRRRKALEAEAAAARAIEARNALVRDLDSRRDLNAQLAGELETARLRLEAAVAGGGPPSAVRLPIGPFRGALPWPVAESGDPSNAPAWRKADGRSGLEVPAREGTPVHAIHDGTVTFAGSFEGYGNLVIVDHGERTYSLYGDLSEMAVGRGMHVDRGTPIGRTGSAPTGTAGLYFELRVAGKPVDAVAWLSRSGSQ